MQSRSAVARSTVLVEDLDRHRKSDTRSWIIQHVGCLVDHPETELGSIAMVFDLAHMERNVHNDIVEGVISGAGNGSAASGICSLRAFCGWITHGFALCGS